MYSNEFRYILFGFDYFSFSYFFQRMLSFKGYSHNNEAILGMCLRELIEAWVTWVNLAQCR